MSKLRQDLHLKSTVHAQFARLDQNIIFLNFVEQIKWCYYQSRWIHKLCKSPLVMQRHMFDPSFLFNDIVEFVSQGTRICWHVIDHNLSNAAIPAFTTVFFPWKNGSNNRLKDSNLSHSLASFSNLLSEHWLVKLLHCVALIKNVMWCDINVKVFHQVFQVFWSSISHESISLLP